MPTGGLDCRNLSEALLTLPELAVDDRFLVFAVSMRSTADKGVWGGGEFLSSAMIEGWS